VIETAWPKPVLPRGGSRVSDEEILSRTFTHMQQGASGTVYGRNVCQHPHIERIVRACMAIVHEGASVSQAMSILNERRTRTKQNAFARAQS
jgi:DhnA family fructose-bisphosphate aldolase class Ia